MTAGRHSPAPAPTLPGVDTPALRLLSLGAGVQSSAVLLLAALGELPRLDGAIFADTGWEPRAVYDHLDRLKREVASPAGIPVHQVGVGTRGRATIPGGGRGWSAPTRPPWAGPAT